MYDVQMFVEGKFHSHTVYAATAKDAFEIARSMHLNDNPSTYCIAVTIDVAHELDAADYLRDTLWISGRSCTVDYFKNE
jgi:hypothetical protein